MLWPFVRGAPPRSTPALLDRWVPAGAFCLEHHGVEVAATPEAALEALRAVGLRDVPAVHALFTLRGLPHENARTLGEFFSTSPFVALGAEDGRELVFGIVGPFWRWRRGQLPPRIPTTPAAFREALEEGRMAAIGNFRVEPGAGAVRLWTETWVFAPGPHQAVPFVAYWLAVGPFSAWIRRLLLRAARRRAEEAAGPGLSRAP